MENTIIIDVEKQLLSADGVLNLRIKAEITAGQLLVVFGNSGAGKSTLLRMLAGLTTPDRGQIVCQGQVWFDSSQGINLKPQQRSIGFMFQDYALFPNMTVLQNIQYAQPQPNAAAAQVLLQRFGLEEFAHRKPAKLSGGQKQRVALARALAHQPRLLLLDEPLSALDADMRRQLQDEIAKTHNLGGTTTLLVSHDLSEVFRLAQRVLCIDHGAVKAFGTPDEVFSNTSVSGKVQITGVLVRIEKNDVFYLLTVVTGMNQILKVTAFESDMQHLSEGDQVMVFTKAFNPMITKIVK